jgi:chromosome segregation ATPase
MFVLNLIPDSFEKAFIPELVAVAAGIGATVAIFNYLVKPLYRGIRRLIHAIDVVSERISEVPVHEDRIDSIEAQIKAIHDALEPTNGDRRSISDRLDTVKSQTIENTNKIDDLSKKVEKLWKESA